MNKILVVAPHPDDETLGCGGTLLRHIASGDIVHWVIVTSLSESRGFHADNIIRRDMEIAAVSKCFGFERVHRLGFDTTQLDALPMSEVVARLGEIIRHVGPDVVYTPYRHDVHSDHSVVFDAVAACTKWFRYPSVRRVLAYETLSETDFNINPDTAGFRPNVFIDIDQYLEKKISIMEMYLSEIGESPFPRSAEIIRALASVRGASSGYKAAEAFILLRERA